MSHANSALGKAIFLVPLSLHTLILVPHMEITGVVGGLNLSSQVVVLVHSSPRSHSSRPLLNAASQGANARTHYYLSPGGRSLPQRDGLSDSDYYLLPLFGRASPKTLLASRSLGRARAVLTCARF